MGDMGSNQVTKEEFITKEFDPFADNTSTKLNFPCKWQLKIEKTLSMAFVVFEGTLERLETAGEELVDVPRMVISAKSTMTDHSTTLELWDMCRIVEVVFNCDQENIKIKESWENIGDVQEVIGSYIAENECLLVFDSQEQLHKIASANNLEVRVSTRGGYINLSDDEEEKMQLAFKMFYNQVYDSEAFKDSLDSMKEEAKAEVAEAEKEGCFIATAVYGTDIHPNLIVLRSFRDNFLASFVLGRKFIQFYYKRGPKFALKVSSNKFLKVIFTRLVDLGVSIVKIFKIG